MLKRTRLSMRSVLLSPLLIMAVAFTACGDEAAISGGQNTSTGGAVSSSSAGGGGADGGAGGMGGGSEGVVETGLGSFGLPPPIIGTSDVYLFGDLMSNDTFVVARYDGTAGVLTPLSLAGFDGVDTNDIAISPDGGTLLVAGHDTDATSDRLVAYETTGHTPVMTVVDTGPLASHEVATGLITFSPDGTRIAFVADIDSDNAFALYVVPSQGGTPPVRVSQVPPSNDRIHAYAWVDATTIAFIGEVTAPTVMSSWSVDVSANTPTPLPLVPTSSLTPMQGVARNQIQVDAQGRIYFRSKHASEELQRLYRVTSTGSGLEQVPGTTILHDGEEASVVAWGLSPDGAALAFAVEPTGDQTVGQVYVLPLNDTVATAVTSFPNSAGNASYHAHEGAIAWDPLGQLITFSGDWPMDATDVDGQEGVFSSPIADTSAQRLLRPSSTSPGAGAQEVYFSTDGTKLYVLGDLSSADDVDLYVTDDLTSTDQTATSLNITSVPTLGDVLGVARVP